MDDNGYPDVIVSASRSDDVIVLFSKPIIVVFAHVISTPSQVNVIECLRNANQLCVTLSLEISAQEAKFVNKKTKNSKSVTGK